MGDAPAPGSQQVPTPAKQPRTSFRDLRLTDCKDRRFWGVVAVVVLVIGVVAVLGGPDDHQHALWGFVALVALGFIEILDLSETMNDNVQITLKAVAALVAIGAALHGFLDTYHSPGDDLIAAGVVVGVGIIAVLAAGTTRNKSPQVSLQERVKQLEDRLERLQARTPDQTPRES